MAAALAARLFDARVTSARKRARGALAPLRWAVVVMVLLNALVWGGMIATARGMIDIHQLVDQAWALSAAWITAIPHLDVTISH
ncbi:hypothetical protein ASD21_08065 [Caulobacter sp. Root1455]|jgi:hypothetical protein|uniref:hypothetical protein n=1 Tax=unclassified Caulobacter TaxID=2648921 RepID=UPI0006F21A0A|nr:MULTISPECIES: hypothetical protein [unclassified Caulobacter]KQY31015.1 hypothetical protein ASD38_06545 [Caulobacter sp. Root487D2Y]KQY95306.1 hypothetical protein ASD21_08065 [Caulobacter sp. Root1455]